MHPILNYVYLRKFPLKKQSAGNQHTNAKDDVFKVVTVVVEPVIFIYFLFFKLI